MPKAKPVRIKDAEELKNETEFYRRKALSNEEIFTSGPRTFECVIKCNGIELGSRTEIFKRKNVDQVLYVLPSLKAYDDLMKLPVARPSGQSNGRA
jgi:hypothetical protein